MQLVKLILKQFWTVAKQHPECFEPMVEPPQRRVREVYMYQLIERSKFVIFASEDLAVIDGIKSH